MKTKKGCVKLREKKIANGNISLYLDIYDNGKRAYETLHLYLLAGTSRETKAKNETTKRIAETIRANRELDLMNEKAGIFSNTKGQITLIDFVEKYRQSCKEGTSNGVKSICNIIACYDGKKQTTLAQIDKPYLKGLLQLFEEGRSKSTARLYYSYLHHILNIAVKKQYIKENPFRYFLQEEIPQMVQTERGFLSIEELKKMETNTQGINRHVVRAFLFSAYCGLRFSDIMQLQWQQIKDIDGKTFVIKKQQKTQTLVYLPLNKKAISYLPEKGINDPENAYVFHHVTTQLANIWMRKWTKLAGISKKVTFHTARHTYATTLITKGADLYTVSKLLGHTNIRTTQIYADIVSEKKIDAVNLLDNL